MSTSTPNVILAPPPSAFVVNAQSGASARELVSRERAEELLKPLLSPSPETEAIEHIVLGGKSFGRESAPVVASALQSTPALKHADFSDVIAGRHTEEALETLQLLCDAIAANPAIQLTHLNLSDNALGVRGIPKIKNAFKNQSSLLHLYFNNDGLQAEAITALTDLIMENYPSGATTLKTFEIASNCLEDAGFKALIPLVKASPELQTLRIATTRVRNNEGAGLAMAQTLLGLKHLTSLSLNDNNLGEEAGPVLAQVIRNNAQHMRLLNLGDIGVEESGVQAILEAIVDIQPHTLQHLDLSANELTSANSSKLLARILKKQYKSLQHLKLEDNELKSRGTLRILRALGSAPALTYLNLTNNQLGDRSVESLTSFLRSHPSLSEIHLNGNYFSADRLADIKSAVADAGKEDALATMSDNDEDEEEEEDDEEDQSSEEEAEEEGEKEDKDVDALAGELAAAKVE